MKHLESTDHCLRGPFDRNIHIFVDFSKVGRGVELFRFCGNGRRIGSFRVAHNCLFLRGLNFTSFLTWHTLKPQVFACEKSLTLKSERILSEQYDKTFCFHAFIKGKHVTYTFEKQKCGIGIHLPVITAFK